MVLGHRWWTPGPGGERRAATPTGTGRHHRGRRELRAYPHLTSREFLTHLAAAEGLSARSARARIDERLEPLNLTTALERPPGTCSGGTARRVGSAQDLLADPRVVVDEPTAGPDPGERARFRDPLVDDCSVAARRRNCSSRSTGRCGRSRWT